MFVMFCVFLYGPFCHGAHKLDLSTLFTTFFLWTSLPFILLSDSYFINMHVNIKFSIFSKTFLVAHFFSMQMLFKMVFICMLCCEKHGEKTPFVVKIKINYNNYYVFRWGELFMRPYGFFLGSPRLGFMRKTL